MLGTGSLSDNRADDQDVLCALEQCHQASVVVESRRVVFVMAIYIGRPEVLGAAYAYIVPCFHDSPAVLARMPPNICESILS